MVNPEVHIYMTKIILPQTKRKFEIEYPDDHGPLWMNKSNLLICLTSVCPNTRFTVRDITGDQASDEPESAGPSNPELQERRKEMIQYAIERACRETENNLDYILKSSILEKIMEVIK